MRTKGSIGIAARAGVLMLAAYAVWLGWQQLGPRKPEIGPVRKDLADRAAADIAEVLRRNKRSMYDVVLVHFVNDPTDYFTEALRREIEHRGILGLRDRTFMEKVRGKLNLRHPSFDAPEIGAEISEKRQTRGALLGAIRSFESFPGGSKIDLTYTLVASDGTIVHSDRYLNEASGFLLNPPLLREKTASVEWFRRGPAWLALTLLLPVFTISFIRTMVQKKSNGRNAFVLGIYTLLDAIFAWFLVGAALGGFWPVLFFVLTVAAAAAYNIRIMTFALRLEE